MPWNPLSCSCGQYFLPQRYVMVFFMQLALLNAYNLRVALNVAMTEMIAPRNNSNIVDACPELKLNNAKIFETKFDWTPNEEAMILYAFYIGYIFSHVPGGVLADRLGSRHVMGICMLLSAIITLIFPLTLNSGGTVAATILRMLLGVAQGPMFPTISTFIQCWIPPRERSLLGSLAFSGSNLGSVTGSIFTGMMIDRSGLWSLPFYVWGAATILWYLFYIPIVFSHPYSHPFITEREATFLDDKIEREKKIYEIPWLSIISSAPVWALVFGQFAHNLLYFLILTDLPKYLKEILAMDINDNALYTAIPFGLLWLSIIIFGFIGDFLIHKEHLSIKNLRICYTAFSVVVPSSLLVLTTYVGCNRKLAIIIYTIAVFCLGPFFSGMKVNVNDITMHYAGTIMAIVNGISAIGAIIGPALVGVLAQDESLASWQIVYWVIFGMANFCGLLFYILAKGGRQPWDYPQAPSN